MAGDLAVRMFDRFLARGLVARAGQELRITGEGRAFFSGSGIDVARLEGDRRPLCRCCLDWSERRSHLGGGLGAAVFALLLAQGWAMRERATRVVRFRGNGETMIEAWFAGDPVLPQARPRKASALRRAS
jgi:hypothetical protein